MKVFIEFPIDSGEVFQNASGAATVMYSDIGKLPTVGVFRRLAPNAYKGMEYQRVFDKDDWKVLGKLLTEEVR